MSHLWSDVFSILFAVASILLIFIVLLQRGRGGGLAGAFGATGGQSAFGTKAGDVFTRITIGMAFVWVALAAITGFAMTKESEGRYHPKAQAPEEPAVLPATPAEKAAGGGGGVGAFDAGNQQNNKTGPATKAGAPTTGAPTTGSTQPAPAKSPSTATTPPAKSSPAPSATKPSAPGK